MPSITVPSISNPSVQALCLSLVAESQPVYVKHQPLPGKPLKECFPIVNQQIAEHGGSQIYGWAILEFRGIWLEAEFHTIWHSPEDVLLDVTPRQFECDEILFLPDPKRTYTGTQVASVFHPLTQHPAVLRYIELVNEFFIETNRGELAFSSNYKLTPKIASINAEMMHLLQYFPRPPRSGLT